MSMFSYLKSEPAKQRVLLLLFESFLIVLGVLLGLAANGWYGQRKDLQAAYDSLSFIADELNNNSEAIALRLDDHRALLNRFSETAESLDDASARQPIQSYRQLLKLNFNPAIVLDSAYRVARSDGALGNLEFELLQNVDKVYWQQDFLREKLALLQQNLYLASNIRPDQSASSVLSLHHLINDLVNAETSLLEEYQSVLALIDQTLEEAGKR